MTHSATTALPPFVGRFDFARLAVVVVEIDTRVHGVGVDQSADALLGNGARLLGAEPLVAERGHVQVVGRAAR